MKALLTILLVGFLSTDIPKIFYSNGFDEAKIGQATYKTVRSKFPGGTTRKTIKKNASTGNIKKTIYEYYSLPEKGLEFFFNDQAVVRKIVLSKPLAFQTDKGIVLGKSRFRDLDAVYGKLEWQTIDGRPCKVYNGFTFEPYHANQVTPNDSLFVGKISVGN